MKNIINLKNATGLVVLIFLTAFMLIAGKGKDGPLKKDYTDPQSKKYVGDDSPKLILGKQRITLLGIFPTPPSGRNSWVSCPADVSPWTGDNSASDLYDHPATKYYCVLNVVCSQYSYNEFVVWTNDPGQNDIMTIDVPTNATYTIFVEYYEPCGNWWTSGVNGRGKWAAMTGQMNASSVTQPIGNFYYVRKEGGC